MTGIPASFLANSWSWESDEGVDEYFKAKGTPWVIRKLILAGSHAITWSDIGNGRFSVANKSVVSLKFEFRLGEEFKAKVYDKSENKIVITCDGESIVERYESATRPEEPNEVYTYTIDGDKMIQKLERAGVSCTRVFMKNN